MLRIVAYAPNGVERFPVDRAELLLGSGADCHIRLPYAGVKPRHARLLAESGKLAIEDLGSRTGVTVNGARVRRAELAVLDEVRLGSIALLVEDVLPAAAPPPSGGLVVPGPPVMDAQRLLEHLSRTSQWVLSDSASRTTLESLVVEMLRDFGGGVLFLFQGAGDKQAIKFVIATDPRWLASGEELLGQVDEDGAGHERARSRLGRLDGDEAWIGWRSIAALDRPYLLVVACPAFRERGGSALPGLEILANQLILGLVHHVGRYEPLLFGRRQEESGLTLVPGLVAGESAEMQRALDRLRAAVDPPALVLLRGEPGTGKQLLARSLHLSGPHREGPFVVASGRGASPRQIEAELFGAEVAGKQGPVIRDGKLLEADGGTLFLEDVDHLPLDLQDRLVRFLRSHEVEPVGSLAAHPVEVRLVVAAAGPLEPAVARDQFRIDLAHRLSQVAVDVPSLRQRRADLPLLIQAAVNHACHQSGQRIQGITVKAMEALTAYDYPGNLPELENIVRRLVYLCAAGRPIDESMLPEEVRLAKVRGLRPEIRPELDLERLVSECERAAIRESLRRAHGNKSQAARQLGLSRNGLTMKIERLGLGT